MGVRLNSAGQPLFSKLKSKFLVSAIAAMVGCGGGSNTPTTPTPVVATPVTSPVTTPSGPANINGNYTLTMQTAPSCSALTVTWPMRFNQTGGFFGLIENDQTPLSSQNYSLTMGGMIGSVSGTSVSTNIDMIYVLKSTGDASWRVSGQFTGTASGTTITGTLNGLFGRGFDSCRASNHPMTFRR